MGRTTQTVWRASRGRQLCHRETGEGHNESWGGTFCWAPSSREGVPSFLFLLQLPEWEYRRHVKSDRVQPSCPPMAAFCFSFPQTMAELLTLTVRDSKCWTHSPASTNGHAQRLTTLFLDFSGRVVQATWSFRRLSLAWCSAAH